MKRLTIKNLKKLKIPNILIPGLILAGILGLSPTVINTVKDYYKLKLIFPSSGYVSKIEDGDTFDLRSGQRIRLIGIDAPVGVSQASSYISANISNQKVYLEYDRYQDDKYGRVLAWVWIGCETTPHFLPPDYMHKSGNESMPGLTDNPKGCKNGKLIQEELINRGFAKAIVYKDRGELKYQSRISK